MPPRASTPATISPQQMHNKNQDLWFAYYTLCLNSGPSLEMNTCASSENLGSTLLRFCLYNHKYFSNVKTKITLGSKTSFHSRTH